eukprot:231528_1
MNDVDTPTRVRFPFRLKGHPDPPNPSGFSIQIEPAQPAPSTHSLEIKDTKRRNRSRIVSKTVAKKKKKKRCQKNTMGNNEMSGNTNNKSKTSTPKHACAQRMITHAMMPTLDSMSGQITEMKKQMSQMQNQIDQNKMQIKYLSRVYKNKFG